MKNIFLSIALFALFLTTITSFSQVQPGDNDPTFNTNDVGFGSGIGADNPIRCIAIQNDGKILIGGNFTSYNTTAINSIARLNAYGTIDNTFNVGTGANSYIKSIAIQSDGKILIGGDFTSFNGTNINYIARLNADGTLDNTFNIGTGANGDIHSIAIQNDGKILIGGYFTSFNGTIKNCFARLNADGTIDNTFNVGTGANNLVNSIVIQSDGYILIGGGFTSYNGVGRNFVARVINCNLNTIALASNPGSNNQTACINSPIASIVYSTTGATGATFTGLPNGVTGSWNANVILISGTPTETGTFNYTINLTGGCGIITEQGTITVNPTNTISLSYGSTNQSVCLNSAITNIIYSTTGATGATFTGLPNGVTGSWNANVIIISGTPTEVGTFNYTINLTGGCGPVSETGTITVINNSINLTSATGTDNQTVCLNTPLTNIIYSTTGATGATITGLPTGVTGEWNANVVTISGTPTEVGTFNYTINLTGGCGAASTSGTITVNSCSGIESINENSSWLVFPNPNNGRFTIRGEKGSIFELMELTGKVINTYTINNSEYTINEKLPAGMYLIKEKKSGKTQRITIQ